MIGLALEGGGAKGAFHMGAVKAFLEEGYEFDGVAGTSIGALNGAIIAQDDFELGYKIWEGMDNSLLFDLEGTQVKKLFNKELDRETIFYLSLKIKEIVENKGLDTSKIRQMLDKYIDEEKIRKSNMDFCIVTVSVSDLKPLELYKEDIPLGRMVDYLMASANFPAFKIERIEGKLYVDGGFYDNCPINLLVRKGYREVIAVRTQGIGIVRKVEDENVKVTNIIPSEDLGRLLNFDNTLIQRNLKMGYYDAMRVIKGLKGRKYYIKPFNEELFFNALVSMSKEAICKIGKLIGIVEMDPRRMLFEKIIPALALRLKVESAASYQDIMIEMFEYIAEEEGLYKYKIYNLSSFLEKIRAVVIKEKDVFNSTPSGIAGKTKFIGGFSREVIFKRAAREFLKGIYIDDFE